MRGAVRSRLMNVCENSVLQQYELHTAVNSVLAIFDFSLEFNL